MTLSNEEFARRFVHADMIDTLNPPRANKMELVGVDGLLLVVGYGWAVYACRDAAGNFYLFGDGYATDGSNVGWAGYSSTTTKHLQYLKSALEAADRNCRVIDSRLQLSDIEDCGPDKRPAVLVTDLLYDHEVEPLDYTGYLYRKDG